MTTVADKKDFTYDIETYINCFTCVFEHVPTGQRWTFEVSDRVNQSSDFVSFMYGLRDMHARMFGYNNEGFDYPVVHHLIQVFERQGYFTALDAWTKAQEIISPRMLEVIDILINTYGQDHRHTVMVSDDIMKAKVAPEWATPEVAIKLTEVLTRRYEDNRFKHTIWANDRIVTQGDLYKIHHFDNQARSTSLKKLAIAQRSRTVVDLPYSPHYTLTPLQMDEVMTYNGSDVDETTSFYKHTIKQIEFRDDLAGKYPDLGDVLNFNDTKIGKKFFERELEKHTPGICYTREFGTRGRKIPNQTHRPKIDLSEVVSPKVGFDHPEFDRILNFFRSKVITQTKGFFSTFDTAIYPDGTGVTTDRLSKADVQRVTREGARLIRGSDGKGKVATHVGGIDFIFGTGGIHGSLHKTSVYPDDEFDLVDVDVASYYPNMFITGRYFPEHLSEIFCDIYYQLYGMRLEAGKKSLIGQMIKLALNGVYGDTGNLHGPFYDPKCMMQITINGQLMLCMLAELAMSYAGCQMVQINTDGMTVKVPKAKRAAFEDICAKWEAHTGLELEHVEYSAMHIRDVNSYLAVKSAKSFKDGGALQWEPDSGVKRIGAYGYVTPLDDPDTRERMWHKNHSALVVPKAAEAALVHGQDVVDFILAHRDPFDFMLSVKVDRSSSLEERWSDGTVTPVQSTTRYYVSTSGCELTKLMPPLAGKTEKRATSVEAGWKVKVVNDADLFNWQDLNWLYYIEEAKKLLN